MALYINGNKTGGGGGNSNIVDASTPSQSVGNENDLYFKTGSDILGYYHYIISTVSTGSYDASIQVQEIDENGAVVDTTVFPYGTSGSWTEFDGHFKVRYNGSSYDWEVLILDDNLIGYTTGDSFSWNFEDDVEYDLKTIVVGNGIKNQYIKIDNNWVELNNSNMRELTQVEYDALTTEEKNNGTVYYITDGDDSNGGYQLIQPIIYSEEEREVGVWVDGKPLYQKTLSLTTPSTTDDSIVSDLSLLQIDVVTDIKGVIVARGELTSQIIPIFWSHTSQLIGTLYFDIDGKTLRQKLSTDTYLSKNEFVTIQYTKTTDVAGSGKWTPQGTPAVHYSTEEQVVGTWINGKTVYEKTFYIPSMGNYDDSIDGYLIAENVVVDDLIGANGFIKIATGLNLGHSYVHITNGFSMLNSYEFALHLNDMGTLLLWTDTSSLGGGIVGQELFITIQYTKPTT